jgi:paired small multidrug resistance pump
MNLWERLLANAELGLPGLIGAVIAIPFHEELKTWKGRLFFVCTGVACAYFTPPLAINGYNIEPALAGGVGFLVGAVGGSLLAAGIRAVKAADLWALLKSKFGSKTE